MHRPVVVISDIPVFRVGLACELARAGFTDQQPSDVIAWARGLSSMRSPGGAFVPVHSASNLNDVRELSLHGVRTVAVLSHPEPVIFALVIAAGAATGVAHDADPGSFIDAMSAAFMGNTLLPVSVAFALARLASSQSSPGPRMEISWLRQLAAGATVASLAEANGMSERQLYRCLHDLYERIGASHRIQAIERAAQLGLL